MPRFSVMRRGLIVFSVLGGLCFASTAQAQVEDDGAPPLSGDVIAILSPQAKIEIPERFAKVVSFPKKILRVDGFDPAVLSVVALTPQQLRIAAITQGVTNVVVHDEDGATFNLEVMVTGDARLLQAVLNRTYPNTSVSVMKVNQSVLLRGWVTEPQDISNIVALAELYYPDVLNQMRVAGPQEVQLRVKVMEVQRSLTRRMGINFTYFNENAAIISAPGPIAAIGALTTPLGGSPTGSLNPAGLANGSMAVGFADPNNTFLGLIEALKQEGLLKLHAETTLTTRSGEAARLVNGGEFPIPVPQSLGTVTIQWREYGVILESLPIVISPSRLKQQVTVEVSERDQTTAVTLNGTTVPGINRRRVQTQAEMNFGETMVIGGLIFTRYTAATSKIPFLGELPGIGTLFRRNNYSEAETELIVLITPEFGSAIPSDHVPPGGPGMFTDIPTDRELYFQGVIEVPKYGERCPDGNCDPLGMPAGGVMPAPAAGAMPPAYDPNFLPTPMPSEAAPTNEPSLIEPPGLAPPPPAPPLDPAVSRRGSRTAWPTTSSAQQISQNRKWDPNLQQAGYQSSKPKAKKLTNNVQPGYQKPSGTIMPNAVKTAQ
jgi:pilus assembly protein CpaC